MSKTMLFLFNTISITYTDEDMQGEQLNIVYGTVGMMAKKDILLSVFSKPNIQWVTFIELVTCVRQ